MQMTSWLATAMLKLLSKSFESCLFYINGFTTALHYTLRGVQSESVKIRCHTGSVNVGRYDVKVTGCSYVTLLVSSVCVEDNNYVV